MLRRGEYKEGAQLATEPELIRSFARTESYKFSLTVRGKLLVTRSLKSAG